MKEKIGAVLASAMVVSGCDTPWIQDVEWPDVVLESDSVSATALPDTLPPAVTAQLPNVVAFERTDTGYRDVPGVIQQTLMNCSGVRIAPSEYLGAAHCTEGISQQGTSIYIDVPIDNGGRTFPVSRLVEQNNNIDVENVRMNTELVDIMIAKTESDDIPNQPPTQFSEPSQIKPGTPLYAVNYEPTADGRRRTPDRNDLSQEDIQMGLNNPAILGAVALTPLHNGRIEALVGLKSYSHPTETTIRPGASGGPVFDNDGKLVGTTIGEFNDPRFDTIKEFESLFNVDIDMPAEAQANVVMIHPTDQSTVTKMRECLTNPDSQCS